MSQSQDRYYSPTFSSRAALAAGFGLALSLVLASPGFSAGPDAELVDLHETFFWGTVGDVAAYSIGTTVCNVGDETLLWEPDTNNHPVIAQNLYRMQGGRFEQIGISWVKHGFGAAQFDLCGGGCIPSGKATELGVGCADPYNAEINGDQAGFDGIAGLGSRAEVNPTSGIFPFPYRFQGQDGDTLYKRMQVLLSDLDLGQFPGARYFIEGQYVTPQDAEVGNGNNNVGVREVEIEDDLSMTLLGVTQAGRSALSVWPNFDPLVTLTEVQVPEDGLLQLGTRVEETAPGLWQYEYALYNMNSHRSVRGLRVPLPAGAVVNNLEFRDIDRHSGEPYAATDWESLLTNDFLGWRTDSFNANRFANALTWGTIYNFRFQSDRPPTAGTLDLLLFQPGTPTTVSISSLVPES